MNYRLLTTALLILALGATQTGRCDDWWQFRGPGGQGVSKETKLLPASWSDTENMVWKTKLPGLGASSPITVGEHIYLTCYSGFTGRGGGSIADMVLHVVCLNRKDGKIVWDTKLKPKAGDKERIRDHGWAAPTPVTDGKKLYVFFGISGVFCFDLNGKQEWQCDVGDGTHGWGCGTSPILYKNVVIVNASVESRSLVGIDKNSGKELWRKEQMRASWNTPHLVKLDNGKHEVVVSIRGKILAYDPESGEELWQCEGIPDYVCPSIVSRKGVVYVIGGRQSRAIAVRAGGRGDVTESHRLWNVGAGANVSSPVIVGDHLYWVSDRKRRAYCLRLSDGKEVYSERVKGQPYASTTAGDGKLYVVTRFSGTLVLAAKPEYQLLSHNKLDDDSRFNASPTISDGRILIRSDKFLYCIGK